jgi:PAS domain S-box-containing protein
MLHIETHDYSLVNLSLDRTINAVNRSLCQLVGYNQDELIGRSVLTLSHPEDVETLVLKLEALGRGGDCSREEYRCLRKDGHTVLVEVTPYVVRDGEGAPRSIDIFVTEVSDRELAVATAVPESRCPGRVSARPLVAPPRL